MSTPLPPRAREARCWSGSYQELLHLQKRTLAALESLAARRPAGQREQLERGDIQPLREMIAFAWGRLAFWEERVGASSPAGLERGHKGPQ